MKEKKNTSMIVFTVLLSLGLAGIVVGIIVGIIGPMMILLPFFLVWIIIALVISPLCWKLVCLIKNRTGEKEPSKSEEVKQPKKNIGMILATVALTFVSFIGTIGFISNACGGSEFDYMLPVLLLTLFIFAPINFMIVFSKKKRKEDIAAGIKRPRNIIFTVFCWLGWFFCFIIYGLVTKWDFDEPSMVIPIMLFMVMICTPKVRHFWRCIFLWQKKEQYNKSIVQNSK